MAQHRPTALDFTGETSPLLVAEFASVLAGPSVGQFFAELGASVVKVENPRAGGDVTRTWRLPSEPGYETDDRSAYFACCNWGKRSAALDLKRAEDLAAAHALAARADVVLVSYKPGDAKRFGLDADSVLARSPRVIHAAITGYGEAEARVGYDAVLQAETGFTYLNGQPDGPPTKMPVALVDVLAAHQLKQAILLALWRRSVTGQGAAVGVSLAEAAASALVNQATNWLHVGHSPQRMGSAHPNIAPYGTPYTCAGGAEIVVAVGTDRQFAGLCEALGLSGLARDERFSTNAARVRHRGDLDAALSDAFAAHDRGALLADLHARHVPAGAVRTVPEVFDAEPMASLAMAANGIAGLRGAAFLPEAARLDLSPPPHLGSDTEAVLEELG